MTLTSLSLLGLTATILAIKVALIVAAVVWAFGGSFRSAAPKLQPIRAGDRSDRTT